jgi:DNA invertase Pin-like site-specific DNA recombinase
LLNSLDLHAGDVERENNMKRAALYLRVSTDGQTTENQRRELVEVAARAGWQIVDVYEDAGISGAKGRADRPAFNRLHEDAIRRRFDVVLAWSVDRLGRSLSDLLRFLEELRGLGVGLYLHKQALDTTTPAGKAMFQMLGVFAEFERAMIQERVRSGLARAKAQGKKLGRPSVVDAKALKIVRAGKKAGLSVRKIAAKSGLSVGTVHGLT